MMNNTTQQIKLINSKTSFTSNLENQLNTESMLFGGVCFQDS